MGKRGRLWVTAISVAMVLVPLSAPAEEYECSILSVLKLGDSGRFAAHEMAPNYMNRKFVVEGESGKVVRTTALKDRLSNFDASHAPQLVKRDGGSFTAVTVFPSTGQYALLQLDAFAGKSRSFLYHTSSGLIFTGVCN